MPKTLKDYLNITPDFLKEYNGKKIGAITETGQRGRIYQVSDTGLQDIGPYRGIMGETDIEFSPYSGLGTGEKEQTLKYYNPNALPTNAPDFMKEYFSGKQSQTFRPRRNNEDLHSYLQAKKNAGFSDIKIGELTEKNKKQTQLKNKKIAEANPNVKANANFINALYQEKYNRNATQAELDKFTGKTVKDASNIILGAENSPFYSVKNDSYINPQINEQTSLDGQTTAILPLTITESEAFQKLPDDYKAIVELMYEGIAVKDEESKKQAEEALNLAKEYVDPYSKIMLEFSLDQIPDEFKLTKKTLQEKIQTQQERLKLIGETMKDASIEEQQALNNIAREYENNLNALQDQMADKGLTYSSKRADLERYIGEQNIGLIQSTKRSAISKIRQLEQNKIESERQAELTKQVGEAQLKAMARNAEIEIGTNKFNELNLSGLNEKSIEPIGGNNNIGKVAGNIENQRKEMLINLSNQFSQFNNPQKISKILNE